MATTARRLFEVPAVIAVRYESPAEVVVCFVAGEAILPLGVRVPAAERPKRASRGRGLFVVRDVRRHPDGAFKRALQQQGIVSVLGARVREADGKSGLVCLVDREPRRWTRAQMSLLLRLAAASSDLSRLPLDSPGAVARGEAGALPGGRVTAEQLRRAFDECPAAGVIASREGRVLRGNQAFAELFGLDSPTALEGRDLAGLAERAKGIEPFVQRLSRGETFEADNFVVARSGGEPIEVAAKVVACSDDRGEPGEIRAYLSDVTRQRRMERELRATKELWSMVERATSDVLWTWNLEEDTLSWNNSGPKCFRYLSGEMRPSIDWHLQRVHPDDRDQLIRGLHAALKGLGNLWAAEYRFRRGDGTYASVLDRACIVRDDRGDPVRVVGWMFDISIWRDAEEAIRFLESVSVVLESTLDRDEALAGVVRAGVPYLGDLCRVDLFDEQGDLGRIVAFPELPEEIDSDLWGFIESAAGPRDFDPIAVVLEQKESVLVPSHATGVRDEPPERDGAPRPMNCLLLIPIVVRDVSIGVLTLGIGGDRRHFEPVDLIRARELARRIGLAVENCRLYATARQAVQDRDDLVRFVSHDLKDPLHSISAAVALAMDNGIQRREGDHRWLEAIARAADRMRVLVDDLLDTSSFEASGFTLSPDWHSLADIARSTCEILRPMAETQGTTLTVEADPDVPNVWVDYPQFLRVFSNLVGNALKFMGTGGHVRIEITRVGEEAIVSINDSGPGMAEHELKQVFTRFWQGKAGDRRGSGLGLSIAQSVVNAHGGRIWVESQLGKGSTFYVAVPLQATIGQAATRQPSSAMSGAAD